jgi:DNA repair protein RadC
VPSHREAPGVLSARFDMPDHERAVIDAALTILGGYLRQPGAAFHTPEGVKNYLRLQMASERREVFAVLFLDSQNRVIAFEVMFVGTLSQTSVYPRELVMAALCHEATAVVLAHNHPSGSVQPSRADEHLTHTLKQALALVDVRVLDHIIVGGSGVLSMAEQGLM